MRRGAINRRARDPKARGEYSTLMSVSLPYWLIDRIEDIRGVTGLSKSRAVRLMLEQLVSKEMDEEEIRSVGEGLLNGAGVKRRAQGMGSGGWSEGAAPYMSEDVQAAMDAKAREADRLLEELKSLDEFGRPRAKEGEVGEVDANDLY